MAIRTGRADDVFPSGIQSDDALVLQGEERFAGDKKMPIDERDGP